MIFDENMETGIGSLRFIDVDDDGVIYGVTSQEEALLLHVPAGLEEVVMPDEVLGSTVTWVSTEALEDAEEGVVIHLADEAGFPYEMLFDAEWDFLQEDGETIFSCNWYLSCAMAQLINLDDQREADAPEVLPRRELVQPRASARRSSRNSTTSGPARTAPSGPRPSGSSTSTAAWALPTAAKAENDTGAGRTAPRNGRRAERSHGGGLYRNDRRGPVHRGGWHVLHVFCRPCARVTRGSSACRTAKEPV